MSATEKKKVAVIGAGIGGLTTGIAMRHAGFDVTVYEKMPELREVGSGLTLWTNAMRALKKVDAADAVRAAGSVVERLENRTSRGKLLSTIPLYRVNQKFGEPCVSIHRAVLQQTLAGVLGNGQTVQLGVTCTGFEQDDGGVTVRFSDGREERADVLVGADGINSVVRQGLAIETEKRYAGYTCWRSAAKADALLPQGTYVQLYGNESTFGIFPVGESGYSWYGTKVRPGGEGEGRGGSEWKREAVD